MQFCLCFVSSWHLCPSLPAFIRAKCQNLPGEGRHFMVLNRSFCHSAPHLPFLQPSESDLHTKERRQSDIFFLAYRETEQTHKLSIQYQITLLGMSCRLYIPLFEECFSGVKKKLFPFVCKCEWDYIVDWLLSTDRQKTNHILQHLPLLDLLQWNEQMNNEGAVSLFLHISQLLSLSYRLNFSFVFIARYCICMCVCIYLSTWWVGSNEHNEVQHH